MLLERLVANLLDNALKHTPPRGEILFEVKRQDQFVQILIRDSGPGISAEERPKIFDKFFTKSPLMRSEKGSIGLGLGLCRWIAEAHQGTIEILQEGKGAAFRVVFPYSAPRPG